MFERFSSWCDVQTRRPASFAGACVFVLIWAVTGPYFHFSDTWQLVINTSTTVVTFLMVFVLANAQGRAADRHYALTERVAKLEEEEKAEIETIEREVERRV